MSDVLLVFQWWGTLFLVGAAAYPITKILFGGPTSPRLRGAPFAGGRATRSAAERDEGWFDGGFLFTKAVGMAIVTFLVYLLATTRLLPFTQATIWGVLGALGVMGIPLYLKTHEQHTWRRALILALEELFFFAALFFWTWIKGHEPSIHALEKYMDFGFTKSILDSRYFPAPDMWYAGHTINYYDFGHTVMAVLTRLSGIDLTYTFNLMLATIFALTFTMSFSIGVQLVRFKKNMRARTGIGAGLLTAFLVTLAGNMQTIYAFTKGYTGDAVKPFWTLFWGFREFWAKLPEGLNTYWYANATRFIPYTIHEFPSYSFVVSDVHGHVLSLPFTLLAIALLFTIWGSKGIWGNWGKLIFYGFLCGVLLMTNALDGPIYLALLFITLGASIYLRTNGSLKVKWQEYGMKVAVVTGATGIASVPFLSHFKSFVNGIAVNCPPNLVANTKVGPLIFEGVEKCQHSPFWMWWILWGFFIYCGLFLFVPILQRLHTKKKVESHELVLAISFVFFILLLIFPEFFYFKDIYPMHFRANTMFKLGYQAFIMLSILSAYTIWTMRSQTFSKVVKLVFYIFLIPQLFLVSIFPIFSVRSYFNSLRNYESIFGMGWFQKQYPDDWAGISWLNQNVSSVMCHVTGNTQKQIVTRDTCDVTPVIVEADGDSYTDYNAYSAFTGLPTIVGWSVHEWLWRGSYDVVAPRKTEVQEIYTSPDITLTKQLLTKYHVTYVIVGYLERQKYSTLQEAKFSVIGTPVFTHGLTKIYRIL